MRAPGFWWQSEPAGLARLLEPLGWLGGAIATRRLGRPGRDPGVPVVCVGNPTVGGAGKTPTALALAQRLKAQGRHPVFLTRGYGGKLPGPFLVTPAHRAAATGDEPLLLARVAPTVVARDRRAGAELAVTAQADVVVMDDGFQNPALAKALSVLVVDGAVGVGNGLCLPAGPLRAPLAPQFARAQAVLLIGEGAPGEQVAQAALGQGLVVLRGRLAPEAEGAARLFGHRVAAFAGIGRPAKFFETLRQIGATPVLARGFPDHHAYSVSEALELRRAADAGDLQLVTTEKDAVRLLGTPAGEILGPVLRVLPVRLVLERDSMLALDALLARALARG